ncbi:biogenesis of lysosome-related organelles complex 1 subunit 2 [Cimex lectularius]|uniref:Biogenesis of lysosome-related organelles complex 1 subunit 2 n=1 Tax=Cimex lectularius TaxID=79782 RepID=A0A8I6R785_CIMLE|nr:biogenesis of lysosome-related organelles complex 1 subunit 2 [Cimex lectularius]
MAAQSGENYCSDDGVTDSPKKGPTLSTSTSSFEALDPHDPNLSKLATSMFQKTSDYLTGELTLTQEDYRLLEAMNNATAVKYTNMKHTVEMLSKNMIELNEKYESLRPLLNHIDQIEDTVLKLEQAAYKLENYSKRLEAKFKEIQKKSTIF